MFCPCRLSDRTALTVVECQTRLVEIFRFGVNLCWITPTFLCINQKEAGCDFRFCFLRNLWLGCVCVWGGGGGGGGGWGGVCGGVGGCVAQGAGGGFSSREATVSFQMTSGLLLNWILTHDYSLLSMTQRQKERKSVYSVWLLKKNKDFQKSSGSDKGSKSFLALRCDCIVWIRC